VLFASTFDNVGDSIVTVATGNRGSPADVIQHMGVKSVPLYVRTVEHNFQYSGVSSDAVAGMPSKIS
jgi:hypothetical protein